MGDLRFRSRFGLDEAHERLAREFVAPDPSLWLRRPFAPGRTVGTFVRAPEGFLVDLWLQDQASTGGWSPHFEGALKAELGSQGSVLEGRYVMSKYLVAIGVLFALAMAGAGIAMGAHFDGDVLTRVAFVLGGAALVFAAIRVAMSGARQALDIAIRKALGI
jgi:hypothetical protein